MRGKQQNYLFINLDKKIVMEPEKQTLTGGSSMRDIALVHPKWGNPFQYEVFQLLMGDWKGDRMMLVEDTNETRDELTCQEGFMYYSGTDSPDRGNRKQMQLDWEKLLNQVVLINYDSHLFMTIDQRLLKRENRLMPYFSMAKAQNKSTETWAGCRVGIEPIDTATFDEGTFFEMFRMIKDTPAYQVAIEDYERRFGKESWKKPS